MITRDSLIFIFSVLSALTLSVSGQSDDARWIEKSPVIEVPFLNHTPAIDGDLSEWKDYAHTDGVWDIFRIQQTSWYEPKRNRLTDHGNEPDIAADLSARYYIAWNEEYLFLGAEVKDNVNDVSESKHQPKRWYYKDAIAWFFEAPRDAFTETFGDGNHAFAFVIDSLYPDYGAWWRYGTADERYIEKPLPAAAATYQITFDPEGRGEADYILEAKINMQATFGKSDTAWQNPSIGDVYSMMIVHCDPDGGEYGGHLLIYGKGDADDSWHQMLLSPAKEPLFRKEK